MSSKDPAREHGSSGKQAARDGGDSVPKSDEVADSLRCAELQNAPEADSEQKSAANNTTQREPTTAADNSAEVADPNEVPETSGADSGNAAKGSRRSTLLVQKHKDYIKSLDNNTETLDYQLTEHLRMSGVYWGLTAMDLMQSLHEMDSNRVIQWLLSCQHDNGAFGGNKDHDPHLLYTLSAVQILALYGKLDLVDGEKVAAYVAGLQQEDGSFAGDDFGEIDTRFSYAALCCLSLLNKLDFVDVPRAVDYILQCQNFDGGFGVAPGLESHAGQIFCCVASLAITGSMARLDRDLLGWWLAERQVKEGGLNGRPEKLPDVCYSWWVLSSLVMMDRVHWIDREKLQHFILDCQDEERGGISDRPDDMVDVFHTYFGVAGLSLLGYTGVKAIDPAYALPVDVVEKVFASRTRV